jgi:methionyl aminopeptidase
LILLLIEGGAKKKKKKPKKKKAGGPVKQTSPPRTGLSKLFPSGEYPLGEIRDYTDKYYCSERNLTCSNLWRVTSEEKRALDRSMDSDFNDLRHAAEVHRQVRQYARKTIKPGMTMTEIAELIENATRALVEEEGLVRGIGFPTGLSLNHVAAHYTPNAGDKTGYRIKNHD